jgi:hypothetical protein
MANKVGIFTFGYHGWGSSEKGRAIKKLRLMHRTYSWYNRKLRGRGVKWIDIRLVAQGRSLGFVGKTPQEILKGNYRHIQELGNELINNLHGNPIADFQGGFAKLKQEIRLAKKCKVDLVLFCHDRHLEDCHRAWVMGALIKRLPRIRSLGIEFCGDLPGFYQLQEILGKEFDA